MVVIYTLAPTADEARRLADASVDGLDAYLRRQGRERNTPPNDVVRLTQLCAARGGPVDATAPAKIAALTFVVVFGLSCGLVVLLAGIRRGWRGRGDPGSRRAR